MTAETIHDDPESYRNLRRIDGVDGRTAQKLRHAGVLTVGDLLDADAERVAREQDLAVGEVRRLQRLAGLLDVPHVGEKRAVRLLAARIGSRQALAAADPATVAERIGVSEKRARRLVENAALEQE